MAAPEPPLPGARGCPGSASLSPPRGDRTLLVRHLPAELSAEEKEDLLKYFGAQSVRVLSDKGRLKHTAFATFPNEKAAVKALTRLHQLKLLGHTLVVEFAKEQDEVHSPCPFAGTDKKKRSEEPVEDDKEKKELGCLTIENGIAPNHGMKTMCRYTPLCPRGLLGPRRTRLCPMRMRTYQVKNPSTKAAMRKTDRGRMAKLMELANLQPKRPKATRQRHVRKRRKIKDMLTAPAPVTHSLHPVLSPSDVFDQPQPVGNKKIEFHISTDMPAAVKKDLEKEDGFEEQNPDLPAAQGDASTVGFGKIFPKPNPSVEEESKEDSDETPSECISRRELEKGRVSREEMETLSVFRSYEPGEPNCRIYVKNLAKHVQEKDLKFIFGRYVDFSSETQRIMFDVRLMKEGRMKGQAFIGLPDEKAAAKALKEANGYVLFGKPMVVQFARSARPKQDSKEGRRK
ncbi:RNA-binding region-containing protein 3 isoform X3 [Pipistrellus kuhlii]|uniref:RNA-binding region-containing protein 3 isoform X3 n=1 Tax=Pipistrellus kuhlii TaxID=59472 RepID=UPI00174F469D|nr:RNA-binding region-containing protein 3 isoform X3 [Pipistrellus kuhlii]